MSDLAGFCKDTSGVLQFIGWAVTLIKVAIPLLIVVLGMLDFGKAVTGGDDKTIKSSLKTVGIRVIAGLIIFFIPSIVMWVFELVGDYKANADSFKKCRNCILTPWSGCVD